jgi:hypothetical protein
LTYYPTLAEDLRRAKEILEEGKAEPSNLPMPDHINFGGTIFGKDTYAAYKLLESFVEQIERPMGDCVCRTVSCHHGASLHHGPNGRCILCQKECWY